MKPMANDLGLCGFEQLFYAGTIKYDTTDADKGVAIFKAPHNCVITRMVAKVNTAFNAGTSNVLVFGTDDDDDAYMAAGDITGGTAGSYNKTLFAELSAGDEIYGKYTQTGTDATAGEVDLYVFAVGIPESL